jgi:hypothetical protein
MTPLERLMSYGKLGLREPWQLFAVVKTELLKFPVPLKNMYH